LLKSTIKIVEVLITIDLKVLLIILDELVKSLILLAPQAILAKRMKPKWAIANVLQR
jgi:hypothetical protein